MTFADAEKYRQAYEAALNRLAREAGAGVAGSPGISVKLSALHPKYTFFHADEARAAMVPVIKALAVRARDADIHFTIDAEEAERLELSLDIIEELVADDDLFDPPVHDRPLLGGGRRDRDLQSLFGRCEPSRDAATILAKPRLDGVEVLVVNQ